jgi:hypothetical protein
MKSIFSLQTVTCLVSNLEHQNRTNIALQFLQTGKKTPGIQNPVLVLACQWFYHVDIDVALTWQKGPP